MSRNKSEGKFLGKYKGRKVRYPVHMRTWLTLHGVACATGTNRVSIESVYDLNATMTPIKVKGTLFES